MKLATTRPIISFTKTLIDKNGWGVEAPEEPRIVTYAEFLDQANRDPLIDLRSEAEFACGAAAEAVNVPLLNNQERHEVGLTYKQSGRDRASELGLMFFERKARTFVEALTRTCPDKRLVLYCWRGGLRSASVGHFLGQLGFQVSVIAQGYKGIRHEVLALLDKFSRHRLLVINGRTGSGKTTFIQKLMDRGVAGVDLEALACHRGSAFGDFGKVETTTQQGFENQLAKKYHGLRTRPCIVLELENHMGPISVPVPLRKNMMSSSFVVVTRDFQDRVQLLSLEYGNGWNERMVDLFAERIDLLRNHLCSEVRSALVEAVRDQDFNFVARTLLWARYDRLYDKSIRRHGDRVIRSFNLTRHETQAVKFIRDYCEV